MRKKSKNTQNPFGIFVEFLRIKRCLTQFRYHIRNRSDFFVSFASVFNPLFYLQHGFAWISTPEGFKFWSDLNEEWIEYLKRLS